MSSGRFVNQIYFSKYINQRGLHVFLNILSHLPLSQWTVRHRKAMSGEDHRRPVRRQVHQEAPEHSQLARGEAGGDRARGGHPAADPAPQHCDAPRRLWEPHRRGSHPGAVSDSWERCWAPWNEYRWWTQNLNWFIPNNWVNRRKWTIKIGALAT